MEQHFTRFACICSVLLINCNPLLFFDVDRRRNPSYNFVGDSIFIFHFRPVPTKGIRYTCRFRNFCTSHYRNLRHPRNRRIPLPPFSEDTRNLHRSAISRRRIVNNSRQNSLASPARARCQTRPHSLPTSVSHASMQTLEVRGPEGFNDASELHPQFVGTMGCQRDFRSRLVSWMFRYCSTTGATFSGNVVAGDP